MINNILAIKFVNRITVLCSMTLTLYYQGHCRTLASHKYVHLEHKIAKDILNYSKINAKMTMCLAVNTDLDFSAARSSLYLIVRLPKHVCMDSKIINIIICYLEPEI